MLKTRFLILLLVAAFLTACANSDSQAGAGTGPSSALDQLSPVLRDAVVNEVTGMEFAELIGIKHVDKVPAGCTDYAEVPDGGGYCLTGVLKQGAEVFVAGHLLRGDVPTDDTIQRWLDGDAGA